jgi:DDE superfamily endonuclease
MSNKNRKILYVSKLYSGKTGDFKMMKDEFPPNVAWFDSFKVWLDSGFQGAVKQYKSEKIRVTFRRTRAKKGENNSLTEEQIAHNKEVGKERIYVEHAIGGIKRYRFLYNRNRSKNLKLLDTTIAIAAALWNHLIDTN